MVDLLFLLKKLRLDGAFTSLIVELTLKMRSIQNFLSGSFPITARSQSRKTGWYTGNNYRRQIINELINMEVEKNATAK